MSGPSEPTPGSGAQLPRSVALHQLRYHSFALFLSALVGVDGRPFDVALHHERWCDLMQDTERLVLLAPRDHSKTTLGLAYILWQLYRHGTDPASGAPVPGSGTYMAVLFSGTVEQARVLMSKFKDMLAVNAELLAGPRTAEPLRPTASTGTRVRFAGGFELLTRSYRTSTRGMHPDLLVLDDVLNDQNTGTHEQRDKTWRYFVDTLLPMHAKQIIALGTTLHADDLLHRLAPPRHPAETQPDDEEAKTLGFTWRRFPALIEATRTTLWPARHPYAELAALRAAEPTMFAREYQNDPRDSLASLFPRELTDKAVAAGAMFAVGGTYHKQPNELVVLGADLAVSAELGADYTVVLVASWNVETGVRRVLDFRRVKGLTFDEQVLLLRDLCITHRVATGVVEQNGFQSWLVDQLQKYPETRILRGHTTGSSKADVAMGIPRVKLALRQELWVMPSGDAASRELARIWQSELAAFGWRDGRFAGIGEHDDTVMASWFIELAIARAEALFAMQVEEIVTMEDLGIERVDITPWDKGLW